MSRDMTGTATMGVLSNRNAEAFLISTACVLERMCEMDIEKLERLGLPDDSVSLGLEFGGEILGVAVLMPYRGGWSIHFYMGPFGRREWSRVFGGAVIEEVLKTARAAYVQIPQCYPAVINFARKLGFERVDTELASYQKGGRLFDREVLKWVEFSAETTQQAKQPKCRQHRQTRESISSVRH